jgi:hypothetical protein
MFNKVINAFMLFEDFLDLSRPYTDSRFKTTSYRSQRKNVHMPYTSEVEGRFFRQAFENRSVLSIVPIICKHGRIITNDTIIADIIAEYHYRTVELHAFDAIY